MVITRNLSSEEIRYRRFSMIQESINELVFGNDLSKATAAQVMDEIMTGEATPAQFGAFVTALRIKGETVEEIAGMAEVMREKALRVESDGNLIDTCGTGGDGSNTINISTISAFVVSGAGLKVAKHGNRAITSSCGSADLLEAAGIKIELGAESVSKCIEEIGIGFMFAPIFHPAMRHAAGPRREIGIRSVFNILGPLTNPARATTQLLGIADPGLGNKMAGVLQSLGCQQALVVHGHNGMDEISISSPSTVWELKHGEINSYIISPEDYGIRIHPEASIKSYSLEENIRALRKVLAGESGAERDVILMNASAALLAGNIVDSISEGITLASDSIDTGAAKAKFDDLVRLSNELA
jgi:anthranilate phosphoribosyltransferase